MKKKKFIIAAIIIIVIIVIVVLIKRNKKQKAIAADAASDGKLANIIANSTVKDPTLNSAAVIATQPGLFITAKNYPYTTVLREEQKGGAIFMYNPVTDILKIGDSINIASGPYAGTHKIWYVYDGKNGINNLYTSTPFTTSDKGFFSKA